MSFKRFLLEKRTSSTDNIKTRAYDALVEYKDNPNIFITFTTINKVGLKPMSTSYYDTPIGIYTYPLKEFWKEYRVEDSRSPGKSAPFAGDRDYIQVLELIDNNWFVNDIAKEYDEYDYETDIDKIRGLISPTLYPLLDNIINDIQSEEIELLVNHPFSQLWELTRILSLKLTNNPHLIKHTELKGSRVNEIWSNLLRKLNYTGFADRRGGGFIHDNESVQAVFLSTKPIKHIKTVLNKDYVELSLYNAIQSNNIKTVESLLKKGANIDEPGLYGHTPLFQASMNNQPEIVEFLLNQGADPNNKISPNQYPPLHIATYYGHDRVMEILLQHGAIPSLQNARGETVFDLASKSGNSKVLYVLNKYRG